MLKKSSFFIRGKFKALILIENREKFSHHLGEKNLLQFRRQFITLPLFSRILGSFSEAKSRKLIGLKRLFWEIICGTFDN